jgi:hypothetical protein
MSGLILQSNYLHLLVVIEHREWDLELSGKPLSPFMGI